MEFDVEEALRRSGRAVTGVVSLESERRGRIVSFRCIILRSMYEVVMSDGEVFLVL